MMWSLTDNPASIALLSNEGQMTYGALADNTKALAKHLPERALVFCLCRNVMGSVIGYVSCINHKVVPLLLDAGIDQGLLDNLIETYKPDYLWLPENHSLAVKYPVTYESHSYRLVKLPYDHIYPLHDDLALLLTTSGSTGSPKLVRQSYENIRSNMVSIAEYLALDDTERAITTLPMSYTYGLSILNSHLHVGASIILTERTLMEREFWQAFTENDATSFGGVPYTYEMLDRLRFYRRELPSLRYMTQAGGKLPVTLHQKLAEYARDTGRKFIVMYGQTEATARMSYLPAEMSIQKYGSMGIAIPGGRLSLIDAEGNPITEADEVGELVYSGANVTLGYAEIGEDLALGDQRHGVLKTGDMAKMDSDGYFYIVGRKKRFLKVFGNRINLDEIEQMVRQDMQLDCACAGVDDQLYLFLTDAARCDAVRQHIAGKTSLHPSAIHVLSLDEIPKSSAGKTQYTALEKYYHA